MTETRPRFAEPEDDAVIYCQKCGVSLEEGDEAYQDSKYGQICPECFEEFVVEEIRSDMRFYV